MREILDKPQFVERVATLADWPAIEGMQAARVALIEAEREQAEKPPLAPYQRRTFGFYEAVWMVSVLDEQVVAAVGYSDRLDKRRDLALLWAQGRVGKLGASRLAKVVFDYSDDCGLEVYFWAHPEPSDGFVATILRAGFVEDSREYRRPVRGGNHVRGN